MSSPTFIAAYFPHNAATLARGHKHRKLWALLLGSVAAIAANVAYYYILRDFVGIEFIAYELGNRCPFGSVG